MCIDPIRYSVHTDWRTRGFDSEEQVRQERLWQAARGEDAETREHAVDCRDCALLMRGFERAYLALRRTGGLRTFAVCPSTAELSRFHYGGRKTATVSAHLKSCEPCRRELLWLARSAETRAVIPMKAVWWGAAAALVLLGFSGLLLRPISYADLASVPVLDSAELNGSAPSEQREALERAESALQASDPGTAAATAREMIRTADGAAAEFVLAMALYKQSKFDEAYAAMRKSERMQPASEYRCWTMLQFALLKGDRAAIEREGSHTAGDPRYASQCREVLERVRRRSRFSLRQS